jgi:hypothetical protein
MGRGEAGFQKVYQLFFRISLVVITIIVVELDLSSIMSSPVSHSHIRIRRSIIEKQKKLTLCLEGHVEVAGADGVF